MKRGIDQVSAWLLAVLLASMTFGVGYGVVRLVARAGGGQSHGDPYGEGGGGHDEASSSHESEHGQPAHGDNNEPGDHGTGGRDASEHDVAPAHSSEHGGDGEHKPAKDHGEHPSGAKDEGGGGHHGAALPTGSPLDQAASAAPWDYRGSTGPDHWGELSASYLLCKSGKRQSPIDLDQIAAGGKLLPLRFHYRKSPAVVHLDPRGMRVAAADRGLGLDVEGERFDLDHLEIHVPSEHKVSGLPFDMELSFVHRDATGQIVVVNVLVEEGAQNASLEGLVAMQPMRDQQQELESFDFEALLPSKRTFYRYDGSLTTPPCSEAVVQMVLTATIQASPRQVDAMVGVLGYNARPAQALNGRKVLKSTR